MIPIIELKDTRKKTAECGDVALPTQNVFYGNSSNQISNFTNVSPVYTIVALYPGGNEQPRALLRRLRSRVTQW